MLLCCEERDEEARPASITSHMYDSAQLQVLQKGLPICAHNTTHVVDLRFLVKLAASFKFLEAVPRCLEAYLV